MQQRGNVAGSVEHAHDLDGIAEGQVEHPDLPEPGHRASAQALEARIVEVARASEGRLCSQGGQRALHGLQEPEGDHAAGFLREVRGVAVDVTVSEGADPDVHGLVLVVERLPLPGPVLGRDLQRFTGLQAFGKKALEFISS